MTDIDNTIEAISLCKAIEEYIDTKIAYAIESLDTDEAGYFITPSHNTRDAVKNARDHLIMSLAQRLKSAHTH